MKAPPRNHCEAGFSADAPSTIKPVAAGSFQTAPVCRIPQVFYFMKCRGPGKYFLRVSKGMMNAYEIHEYALSMHGDKSSLTPGGFRHT
jgi:hypothetical protein